MKLSLLETFAELNQLNDSNVTVDSDTRQDKINQALLDDIKTAAKVAGVKVTITTAVSNHDEKTSSNNISRHTVGNAVDISIVNGRNVASNEAKPDTTKFVEALVKMGYAFNVAESGNDKVVLTYGFPGHDNHVHVSNRTGNVSTYNANIDTSSVLKSLNGSTSSLPGEGLAAKLYAVTADVLQKGLQKGLQTENSKNISIDNFITPINGNSLNKNIKQIRLRGSSFDKIVAPYDGIITTYNKPSCSNGIMIKHNYNGEIYYSVFCNIGKISNNLSSKVSKGDIIGSKGTDDVSYHIEDIHGNKVLLSKLYSEKKSIDTDKIIDSGKSNAPLLYRLATKLHRLPFEMLSKSLKENINSDINRMKNLF